MTETAIITASVMKELKSCSLYSSSYIVYSSADQRKAKYLRVNTTQKIFCNAFPAGYLFWKFPKKSREKIRDGARFYKHTKIVHQRKYFPGNL